MSLAYPVARSLEDAVRPGVPTARTRREAASRSPGLRVEGLETGWLHLAEADAATLLAAQGGEGPAGHLQDYEDSSGHRVIAVTWWRVADPMASPAPARDRAPPSVAPGSDHTDDLYFRRGRNKPRRRKQADPNQLDLFDLPKM